VNNNSNPRSYIDITRQFITTYEMVDGVREKYYFRNWWMTTGAVPDANPQVPVRDEAEEVNAVIDLINVANEAVKKPVFLVIGNDLAGSRYFCESLFWAVQSFEGVLRSQHRAYDGRGEVARTQDVWGAEGISGRVKFLPLAWAGQPLRLSRTKNLHFAKATFPGFSA
jgi:hypothetical protein